MHGMLVSRLLAYTQPQLESNANFNNLAADLRRAAGETVQVFHLYKTVKGHVHKWSLATASECAFITATVVARAHLQEEHGNHVLVKCSRGLCRQFELKLLDNWVSSEE